MQDLSGHGLRNESSPTGIPVTRLRAMGDYVLTFEALLLSLPGRPARYSVCEVVEKPELLGSFMRLPIAFHRSWGTRALATAVVFLLLLSIVGIVLAVRWPFTRSRVLESIRESWTGTVQADRIRSTYFPHPGCIINGLVLTIPRQAGEPMQVVMSEAQIQARYSDLILRPGHLARLVVKGLRLEFPASDSGASSERRNAGSRPPTVSFGEIDTKDAVLVVKRSHEKPPLTFEIHRLVLRSVRSDAPISYESALLNPEPPGEVHVRGQFGPWQSRALRDLPISGSYIFDKANLGVFGGIAGELSSTGSFDGILGQMAAQGTIEVPAFQVTRSHHSVALSATYHAGIDATRGDTDLKQVDVSFLHTAVHAAGTISSTPGDRRKTASLNLTVRQGHIQDVLDLFMNSKSPPMEGLADLRTHVVIPPGDEPFLKKLTMEGTFAIADAVLTNPARQGEVDALSKRASGNKNEQGTVRTVARIDGNLVLKNETAEFSALSFQIPGAKVDLTGLYHLRNEQIDFHGDAKTHAVLSEQTNGLKAVLLKPLNSLFKKKQAGADVRVGMTGTFDDPHFGIELPVKK